MVFFYDFINEVGIGYCFDCYEFLDCFMVMVWVWEGFCFKVDW